MFPKYRESRITCVRSWIFIYFFFIPVCSELSYLLILYDGPFSTLIYGSFLAVKFLHLRILNLRTRAQPLRANTYELVSILRLLGWRQKDDRALVRKR